ncbi:MAG: hypothetical protein ACRC57_00435 [Sarcina sp.]
MSQTIIKKKEIRNLNEKLKAESKLNSNVNDLLKNINIKAWTNVIGIFLLCALMFLVSLFI